MAFRVVAISLSAALLSGCMATGGTGYGMSYDSQQERDRRFAAAVEDAKQCRERRRAAHPELFAKLDEALGRVPPGARAVPLALRASKRPFTDEMKAALLESTTQVERVECRELELKADNMMHPRMMALRQRHHNRQDETILKALDGKFETIGEYWIEVQRNGDQSTQEQQRIASELNQQARQDATLAAQQRAAQWQAYQAQQAEQRRQDDAMWAPYKDLLRPKASFRCTKLGYSTTCTEQ